MCQFLFIETEWVGMLDYIFSEWVQQLLVEEGAQFDVHFGLLHCSHLLSHLSEQLFILCFLNVLDQLESSQGNDVTVERGFLFVEGFFEGEENVVDIVVEVEPVGPFGRESAPSVPGVEVKYQMVVPDGGQWSDESGGSVEVLVVVLGVHGTPQQHLRPFQLGPDGHCHCIPSQPHKLTQFQSLLLHFLKGRLISHPHFSPSPLNEVVTKSLGNVF